VSAIERLVDVVAGQYRWGLHPLKVLIALLLPLVIVWLADRRLRTHSQPLVGDEARTPPPPRADQR
jgi:hypothetical protein